MMKKLLVLALVLGMATMANAALTVTITGPTSLDPGATGTYLISKSGGDALSADVDVVANVGTQVYGIGGGVVLPTNADSALNWTAPNTTSGNYELACMDDITGLDLGTNLFNFTWTAPMMGGTYTISMIENSFIDLAWEPITGNTLVGIDVLVIPEPMTMALLGLGGLFLRRRK